MTKFMLLFVCIFMYACNSERQENPFDVQNASQLNDLNDTTVDVSEVVVDNLKIVNGKVIVQWVSEYKDNEAYSYEVLFSADGQFGDVSVFKTDTARGHLRCDADKRGVCPGIVYFKEDAQQVMQFEHDFESTISSMINNPEFTTSGEASNVNYLKQSRYQIRACAAGWCSKYKVFALDNDITVTVYPMHLKFDGLHTFGTQDIQHQVHVDDLFISLVQYDDNTTDTNIQGATDLVFAVAGNCRRYFNC